MPNPGYRYAHQPSPDPLARHLSATAIVRPAVPHDSYTRSKLAWPRDELTALGIDIASTGVAHDCMEIEFCAADPDRSLRLLTERYGPALRAVWLAESRTAKVPKAFGSWIADGMQLTVFYGLNHNTERPGRVEPWSWRRR